MKLQINKELILESITNEEAQKNISAIAGIKQDSEIPVSHEELPLPAIGGLLAAGGAATALYNAYKNKKTS